MVMRMRMGMQVALLLALTAVCNGILPEIVYSGISHILLDNSVQGGTEQDSTFVEVEQLPEDLQHKPEDAFHQKDNESDSSSPHLNNLPPSHHNETASDNESVHTSVERETNHITTDTQFSDLGNNIDNGCSADGDCGKDRYCHHDTHNSKCLPCKAIDMSCTKDKECCGDQLCVWGQCSVNATKGEAGSTCEHQTDCSPDLCCLFHKALLFPVCSTKPIERERCFGASNHLLEMLSWDVQDDGPRKHCPCAGNLHCQHLGRGSMCLKGEDSSEEELTDSLYSEIDYII
ncbi:dickkopf-related protein 3a [Notothenia coriiceps]|uniref:Dickkopf-related protein 3 n=1 Tax=Notothenia coriiceps TaxID=8208 RepID=A0A6I9PXA1_9TELE|nr:PREDICTED: dickkopf-related protein 3 [Notothenia coriiceps]XP_010789822.1 PREDICTED: dickkopf-related protein 3 [Notothenia coriiceps]